MNISIEEFDRLMRFLDGEMELEEIVLFEKELNASIPLKDQLEFQLKLMHAGSENPAKTIAENQNMAENDADKNLQSILTEAGNIFNSNLVKAETPIIDINYPKPTHSSKARQPVSGKPLLAAASVVLLMILSTGIFYLGKNKSTNNTAAKEADTAVKTQDAIAVVNDSVPREKQVITPSRIDYAALAAESFIKDAVPIDPPEVLAQAIEGYAAGNYQIIHQLDLDDLPKTRGDKLSLVTAKAIGHYYKGLSFMISKDNEQARINLQWVIDNAEDTLLQIKAAWNQALVYLKNGDINKSRLLLKRVSLNKIETAYKKRATVLIKRINAMQQ